jgi:hypothetical protein
MNLPVDLCGIYVDVKLGSFVKRSKHSAVFE